jgi:hypothetical protein
MFLSFRRVSYRGNGHGGQRRCCFVVAGALDCSGWSFEREGETGFGLALHKYNAVIGNCCFVVAGRSGEREKLGSGWRSMSIL